MQLLLKSIVVGTAGALLTFFLWDEIRKETIRKTYSLESVLEASPHADTTIRFSFKQIREHTEERLRNFSYKYEIQRVSENRMKITVAGLKDTNAIREMLTASGRLQLRELYNLSELSPMLTRTSEWIDSVNRLSIPVTKQKARDSVSDAVSALLDSMESKAPEVTEVIDTKKMILFSDPYVDISNRLTGPAEIGYVQVKDTAKVRSLFNRHDIKTLGPTDAVLCYGTPVKQSPHPKEFNIPLYFLKTYKRSRALLENSDIADANVDFDSYNGQPIVYFQFTPAASRTWQTMTKLNVQRSIAIILFDLVISAPKVESEIAGGSCRISGNFSTVEAASLSQQIKSPLLPGNLQLISTNTKIETDSNEQHKKILATATVFVVLGLVCLLILKTLKIN